MSVAARQEIILIYTHMQQARVKHVKLYFIY